MDVAVRQLQFELQDELLHHPRDHLGRQIGERDHRIEPVAELRREHLLDRFLVLALAGERAEAQRLARHVGCAGIGGHDEDGVAEIHRLAVVIGQLPVVHHLQQDVEQVGMRLLDLVEQQHAVRMLIDRIGQQAALIVADIARGRTDQPADRMPFHIFGHVEPLERDSQDRRQLARDLGLAHAGRAGEQIVADRLVRIAQARTAELDRGRHLLDRLVLPEHDPLEIGFQAGERLGVVGRDRLGRNPRHCGDHGLDLLGRDDLLALVLHHQHLHRAGLVDDVDRLVGQLAIVDVARRQFHRRLDRGRRVPDVMMRLIGGAQARQDRDRILDRRFVDVDLLEPAQQRAVLFEMVAELLVGGGADAADRPARQRGLEQVGRIHRAAAGGARADHGVDLVDEQHRVRQLLQLGHDLLQPLLEIAAIARTGQQRAHVERVDHGFEQHLGHFALDDLERQPLGDRGLADAGLAHIERVVLRTAAQDLHGPVHFRRSPDQRVDLAGGGLLVQVDGELLERAFALLAVLAGGLLLVCSLHVACLPGRSGLADAVADETHRIEAVHVLLLQEEDGIALALAEQRDQHVAAGHLLAARGLDVQDRALDDALETGGGRGIGVALHLDRVELGIEIERHRIAQLRQLDAAGQHHLGGMLVVDQGQQQMFEHRIFMAAGAGGGQRIVQRLFQLTGE